MAAGLSISYAHIAPVIPWALEKKRRGEFEVRSNGVSLVVEEVEGIGSSLNESKDAGTGSLGVVSIKVGARRRRNL